MNQNRFVLGIGNLQLSQIRPHDLVLSITYRGENLVNLAQNDGVVVYLESDLMHNQFMAA